MAFINTSNSTSLIVKSLTDLAEGSCVNKDTKNSHKLEEALKVILSSESKPSEVKINDECVV
jgi:hypothetical protein